jgi:hypothetical protein
MTGTATSMRVAAPSMICCDLAEPGTPIGEAELKQLAGLLHGPLASKTMEAIRTASRLADDHITRVAAAMAAKEVASQAEASTA